MTLLNLKNSWWLKNDFLWFTFCNYSNSYCFCNFVPMFNPAPNIEDSQSTEKLEQVIKED